MRESIYSRVSLLTLPLLALLLLGCAVTETSRFYILEPLTGADAVIEAPEVRAGLSVKVGPLTLPEYLNRPQIVTRAGKNELSLSEFDRWAEPLQDNISLVLIENLRTLLSSEGFYITSWKDSSQGDYRLRVDIIRFDVTTAGKAKLVTRWSLAKRDKGASAPVTRTSTINASSNASSEGTGYKSMVSALNQTLAEFSSEIAGALRALPR